MWADRALVKCCAKVSGSVGMRALSSRFRRSVRSTALHLLPPFFMVFRRARHERLVLLWRQLRQPLQERDHVPDQLVAMSLAPGRHGGELDAMLDRPELLRGREIRPARK